MFYKINPDQHEVICERYIAGESSAKIAEDFKVSKTHILRILRKYDISVRNCFKLNQIQQNELIELYLQGYKAKQLGVIFGLSSHAVIEYLARNNIKIRSNSEECRKYQINEHYFDIIDNEEKAYYLGLLFADGCNLKRGFAICLSKNDAYVVEALLESLYPLNKPLLYDCKLSQKNSNHSDTQTLCVINKYIAEVLEKHGCVPRKSLILQFPQNIDDSLMSHFIRGYFDGDGCVSINKKRRRLIVGFVGTSMFLDSLQDYLLDKNIIKHKTKLYATSAKNEKIKEWKIGHQEDILSLYDYLYNDVNIFLYRKKNKFIEWMNMKGIKNDN